MQTIALLWIDARLCLLLQASISALAVLREQTPTRPSALSVSAATLGLMTGPNVKPVRKSCTMAMPEHLGQEHQVSMFIKCQTSLCTLVLFMLCIPTGVWLKTLVTLPSSNTQSSEKTVVVSCELVSVSTDSCERILIQPLCPFFFVKTIVQIGREA